MKIETQERRLGIAHAIFRAIEEGFLDGPFLCVFHDPYTFNTKKEALYLCCGFAK